MKQIVCKCSFVAIVCFFAMGVTSCRQVMKKALEKELRSERTYDHADRYRAGNVCTTAMVREIEITWVGGAVRIESADSDTLSVSETADLELNDTTRLHWYLDHEGTLHIEHAKSCRNMPANIEALHKAVVIRVPRSRMLEEVTVDGSGIDFTMTDVVCREVDVEGVGIRCNAVFPQAPHEISLDGAEMYADVALKEGTTVSIDTEAMDSEVTTEMQICDEEHADCRITLDGLSCKIRVHPITHQTSTK